MTYPTIISFYTNDWEYPSHAQRLKQECNALGLSSIITELPSVGYLQNCQKKPFFIRDTIHQLKSPVLWIDVDASIYRLPDFFYNLDADVSLKKKLRPHIGREWHVGTMWFNYTSNTLSLLDLWCEKVLTYNSHIQLSGDHSDESAINELYFNNMFQAKIVDMPLQYFYVDELTGWSSDAVIFHRISKGESKLEQSKLIGIPL